ncbi:MAG: KOW domain-containing RNA-binding protein [Lachnospiraceae bacterium]|nr:KOW domain-containing RNA-binding protein [Lachnospiraceae bacterium]
MNDLSGHFAKSKSGHDKEKIFIIIGNTAKYADIVDGISRTIEKPKRKNIKHLAVYNETAGIIHEKLLENKQVSNEEVKFALSAARQQAQT